MSSSEKILNKSQGIEKLSLTDLAGEKSSRKPDIHTQHTFPVEPGGTTLDLDLTRLQDMLKCCGLLT